MTGVCCGQCNLLTNEAKERSGYSCVPPTSIRETKETNITLELCLDGVSYPGVHRHRLFDHMLTTLAFYAGWGMQLSAQGDLQVDGHHTVEDVGIVLGQAFPDGIGKLWGFTGMVWPLCRWMRRCAARS